MSGDENLLTQYLLDPCLELLVQKGASTVLVVGGLWGAKALVSPRVRRELGDTLARTIHGRPMLPDQNHILRRMLALAVADVLADRLALTDVEGSFLASAADPVHYVARVKQKLGALRSAAADRKTPFDLADLGPHLDTALDAAPNALAGRGYAPATHRLAAAVLAQADAWGGDGSSRPPGLEQLLTKTAQDEGDHYSIAGREVLQRFLKAVTATPDAAAAFQIHATDRLRKALADLPDEIAYELEPVRRGLDALELRLGQAVGDVGRIGPLVERIAHRLADDHSIVPLRLSHVSDSQGLARFHYRNPTIRFRPRPEVQANLDAFLDDDAPFCWWLLTGEGGSGKSRMALELCLQRADTWRAGFLFRDTASGAASVDGNAMETWQPERNTLIVVDYVSAMPQDPLTLAIRLAARKDLKARVRLLLLERREDELFRTQFRPKDMTEQRNLKEARWRSDPLRMQALTADELYAIACDRVGSSDLDAGAFHARHERVDKGRRPLTALIVADAMAQSGESDDLTSVVRDLLERERNLSWPCIGSPPRPRIRPDHEDRLLALATMVGGIGRSAFETLPQAFKRDLDRDAIRAVIPPAAGRDGLGKLEPDMLGEFFCLEAIASDDGLESHVDVELVETAWRLDDGAGMLDFALRAHQTWPAHAAAEALLTPARGVALSYAPVFLALTPAVGNAHKVRAERFRAELNSDAAAALMFADLMIGSPDEAGLREVARLLAAHPEEPTLREAWAKAVPNFAADRAAGDPDGVLALLQRLFELTAAHPEEPALREAWAKAAYNFAHRRAADDPDGVLALLQRLFELTAAHPEEPALREEWAKAVFNFALDRAADDPDVLALLQQLFELTAAHPEEPALREVWAKAVFNFAHRRAADDPDGVLALLQRLFELMAAHPEEPALREAWAKAVPNFARDRAADDPDGVLALLQRLFELMAAHPEEPALREEWAKAVPNFAADRAAGDPDGVLALLQRLFELTAAHPGEPTLREAWANAVYNFAHRRAADDPDGVLALLQRLFELTAAHPEEPALREAWAKAVPNFAADRAAGDPDGVLALLQRLFELTAAHPGEPTLREVWAKAVYNFAHRRAADDPDGVLALFQRLFELTAAHPEEPALREAWAKAVSNFARRRAADDPDGVLALLQRLFELTAAHPEEPALREALAKAAYNFAAKRAADDPDGVRALPAGDAR